jgi:putative ABC transport system permease protein
VRALRVLVARITALLYRRRVDAELDDEIRSHLEIAAADYMSRGMTAADAERAARRSFGGLAQIREECREQRGWPAAEAVLRDVRHAVRVYAQAPVFTIVVAATLGLGIGATAAIFAVVNTVVLRPLDYPDPDRLVDLFQISAANGRRGSLSPPNYFDLRDHAQGFSGIAAYWSPSVTLTGLGGEPQKALAATCTHDLFGVLGVEPQLGRAFISEDDRPGAPRVALLGDGLWRRRYGADPSIVGQTITIDGNPTLVVGVMPARFDFPVARTELWVPLRLSRTQPPNPAIGAERYRQYRILSVVARLAPGVSLDQAQAELGATADNFRQQYPDANRGLSLVAVRLLDVVTGAVKPVLFLLLAGAVCVLLVACVNAGGLMLVRAASRSRDTAVRMALGASRGRIFQQMLIESIVLALLGGIAGLALSVVELQLLLRLVPASIPRIDRVHIDVAAVAFSIGIATISGLAFGVAPALQAWRPRSLETLRGSGRGPALASHHAFRHTLVVVELSLCTVLLVTAALFVESLVRLGRVDLGLRPEAVVAVDRIELPRGLASPERSARFFDDVLRRVRQAPGVVSVGATLGLPLDARARFFVDESAFTIEGRPPVAPADRPVAPLHVVTAGYFSTLRIPLKRGRWFDDHDAGGSPGVAVINQAMAARYWPNENPVGQYVTHDLAIVPGQPTRRQIVGVVGDVRHFGLTQPAEAQMFVPHSQMPWPSMALVVGTSLPLESVTAGVRAAIAAADATIPVPLLVPLDRLIAGSLGEPRLRAWLVGAFAASALLLAAIGLYGTMSSLVQQRTSELGLRIALGATPGRAGRLIMASGLKLTLIGVAPGLLAGVLVSRAITAMLFGVGSLDATAFVGSPLLIVMLAVAACYIPARRVMRLDPLRAINEPM